MRATDHLEKYGITPRLKTNGKIGLQGVGSLPESAKAEIIAWAKSNRENILQELNPDVKNVLTYKGLPRCKKRHRPKFRPVTGLMVESWRVGRKWILEHLDELEAAGWTRHELLRADRFRYPCGNWGPAFTGRWEKEKVKIEIETTGAIVFTWTDSAGRPLRQKAARIPTLKG